MTRIRCLRAVLVLGVILHTVDPQITKCEKTSACSCNTDNGVIDLSGIGNTDGTARFRDVPAPDGNKFSWNPCTAFTEGTCNNVAACQIQGILPPAFFNIGTQDSATFGVDQTKGQAKITYSADTFFDARNLTFIRKAVVTLVCVTTRTPGEITAEGETPSGSGNYLMTLKSSHACEQITGGGGGGGLSVGSVLVIIVFVTLILYVISGLSIQKFVRHAEGREMIPNYTFWSVLPGLVKDGFLFTISMCRGRGSSGVKVGYNDI